MASFADYSFPMKLSQSYEHTVDVNVSGGAWWQSGYITVTNNSNQSLENWVFEFETNKRIKGLENVKFSVKDLGDGTFHYTVSPVSWKQWKANARWTHKNAVKPNKQIKFKIYGNKGTPISDLEVTSSKLIDKDTKVTVIDIYKYGVNYTAGDIVYFDNGQFYKAKISHTAQWNWNPARAFTVWNRIAPPIQ